MLSMKDFFKISAKADASELIFNSKVIFRFGFRMDNALYQDAVVSIETGPFTANILS